MNMAERFFDDPLIVKDNKKHRRKSFSFNVRQYIDYTEDDMQTQVETNDNLLRTVHQAAHEIRLVGNELGHSDVAQKMSCNLIDMKDKDELTILEYCVKLYTTATFIYRACHRHLNDYYSSDRKTFSNYIALLNQYINSHGKSYVGTVYRGANLDDEKLKLFLTSDVGSQWYCSTYLSTSKSRKFAEIYENVRFIITIEEQNDRRKKVIDISKISAIPNEEEVLIAPKYRIIREKNPEFDPVLNKHVIHLISIN